jgi:hypothetical protein
LGGFALARTLGVLFIPKTLSSGPTLAVIANATRRATRAVRMRLIMVKFLSDSGERFDGMSIAKRACRHITRTGYCTGYPLIAGEGRRLA